MYERVIRYCNVSGNAVIKLRTLTLQQPDILRQKPVSLPAETNIQPVN